MQAITPEEKKHLSELDAPAAVDDRFL